MPSCHLCSNDAWWECCNFFFCEFHKIGHKKRHNAPKKRLQGVPKDWNPSPLQSPSSSISPSHLVWNNALTSPLESTSSPSRVSSKFGGKLSMSPLSSSMSPSESPSSLSISPITPRAPTELWPRFATQPEDHAYSSFEFDEIENSQGESDPHCPKEPASIPVVVAERDILDIVTVDLKNLLKDRENHDFMRYLNYNGERTHRRKQTERTLKENAEAGSTQFANWLRWAIPSYIGGRKLDIRLSSHLCYDEGSILLNTIRLGFNEPSVGTEKFIQNFCLHCYPSSKPQQKFQTVVRERIRPMFSVIFNWFSNSIKKTRVLSQEEKFLCEDWIVQRRHELEYIKVICARDRVQQDNQRAEALHHNTLNAESLLDIIEEITIFILAFQRAFANETRAAFPGIKIDWPEYLTLSVDAAPALSVKSESEVEKARRLLALCLGGGMCFPLRSGAIFAINVEESFKKVGNDVCLNISANDGHQKNHSLHQVFWPTFMQPFFNHVYDVLKGHPPASKKNLDSISTFYEQMRLKYAISIPELIHRDSISSPSASSSSSITDVVLYPKYLRRAYSTLGLSLYFRRIFQIHSINYGIGDPIGLLFAINAMMAHTFSQAMGFAYNRVPEMRAIWDTQNTSTTSAQAEERNFWKTDIQGTKVKDDTRLLYLAQEAWHCVEFSLRDVSAPTTTVICHYCGKTFPPGETQCRNSHEHCLTSVSGFFVKRLRDQRKQVSKQPQTTETQSNVKPTTETEKSVQSTKKKVSKKNQSKKQTSKKTLTPKKTSKKTLTPKKTSKKTLTPKKTSKKTLTPKKTSKKTPKKTSKKNPETTSKRQRVSDISEPGDLLADQEIFEVNRIVKKQVRSDGVVYLVEWTGFPLDPNDESSWVKEEDFICPRMLRNFHKVIDDTDDDCIDDDAVSNNHREFSSTSLITSNALSPAPIMFEANSDPPLTQEEVECFCSPIDLNDFL